ncbi:phosphoadenosine phosphosulfate reductase family protein [Polaromonas naphthalenivorans]|nr:phosphoadenosine phosphosulfate reductase family protein [Polaromonas naphthalenivorans]
MQQKIFTTFSLFQDEEADDLKSELIRINELIARGAIFVVNHSGGKDSQAMFHFITDLVPRSQIFVVHAELPEVEWEGVLEHIQSTVLGMTVHTCRSRRMLLEMIRERGMFPSPSIRQCTSDLKRGPIERTIRRTGHKLIVNCIGLRSDESSNRAKLATFKYSEKNSKNDREWYDWLPIHHWTVEAVFAKIKATGQVPHWAYSVGMSRLSCVFCIMASTKDLTIAAQHNPKLYSTYVGLEHTTGQVMMMPSKSKGRQTLEQITGVIAEPEAELVPA